MAKISLKLDELIDGEALRRELWRRTQMVVIVGRAQQHQKQRAGDEEQELLARAGAKRAGGQRGGHDHGQCRHADRKATPLWRRNAVRGTVRRHCDGEITEHGKQREDQAAAQGERRQP